MINHIILENRSGAAAVSNHFLQVLVGFSFSQESSIRLPGAAMALATVWPRKVLGFNLSLHRELPASSADLKCQQSHILAHLSVPGCSSWLRLDQNWDDTDGPQRKLLSCWAVQLPSVLPPFTSPSHLQHGIICLLMVFILHCEFFRIRALLCIYIYLYSFYREPLAVSVLCVKINIREQKA